MTTFTANDLTPETLPIAAENWYTGDVTCVTKSYDKHILIEAMSFEEKLAYMQSQYDSSYNYIPEIDDRVVSWGFSRPGYEATSARDRVDIQAQEALSIKLTLDTGDNYLSMQDSLSPVKTLSKIETSTDTLTTDFGFSDTSCSVTVGLSTVYSAPGYVLINDEIIKYTKVNKISVTEYVLYGLYRSCFCTADNLSHSATSVVQPITFDYKTSSVSYSDSDYLFSSQSNFLNINLKN